MKILLIDDDKVIGILMKNVLKKKGYKIRIAKTGLEGFKILKKDKPELILLDKKLPDVDGLKVCKEICFNKKEYGNIPIIISGMNEGDIEKECLESGAIDFIEKPFNIRNFELKIRNIINFINFNNQASKKRVIL